MAVLAGRDPIRCAASCLMEATQKTGVDARGCRGVWKRSGHAQRRTQLRPDADLQASTRTAHSREFTQLGTVVQSMGEQAVIRDVQCADENTYSNISVYAET